MTVREKVIVCVPTFGLDIERMNRRLVDHGFAVDWISLAFCKDPDVIVETTKPYQVVISGGEPWEAKAIEAAKGRVKMITKLGAGYDTIDVDLATQAGIAVANVHAGSATIAEHAVALMLSVLRRIPTYDRRLREGQWTTTMLSQLYGKTVGLVGFGAIAKTVARMLQGFSTRLLAYDLVWNAEEARQLGVTFCELDELLGQSDVVSLHTPLTPATAGMVDRAFLGKMKRSAILINTSRGRVVNEADLAAALQNGTIAGAGLDVFAVQPLPPDSVLPTLEQVVMSSHIGGMTPEAYEILFAGCTQNILDFYAGRPFPTLINPEYKHYVMT